MKDKFNDPANKKFHRIWTKEADIVEELTLGMEWYAKWSHDRDNFAAARDEKREKFSAEMVEWWDRYLVKAAGHLAKHKMHVEAGKDDVTAEFTKAGHTCLSPIYDALSALDDTQIKSGKEIFEALKPLMDDDPASVPKPEAQSPLDKGNPFKKGPGA
ncbi:MAG: hypothetical protein ACAH83_08365 [Alphaproteobacteria bacterium]